MSARIAKTQALTMHCGSDPLASSRWLLHLLLWYFLVQLPQPDVAQGALRVPRRNAQGLGKLHLAANAHLAILEVLIDHFLVVDPGLNAVGRDPHADLVPLAGLELHVFGGVVLGSIEAVDARQPHHAASP